MLGRFGVIFSLRGCSSKIDVNIFCELLNGQIIFSNENSLHDFKYSSLVKGRFGLMFCRGCNGQTIFSNEVNSLRNFKCSPLLG